MKTIICNEQTFLENPSFFVDALREFCSEQTYAGMLNTIKNNCFYIFVFDEHNDVVSWGRCAKTYGRKTMWCIRQVETKEQYQGKGFAGLLYAACEEYLQQDKNAKRIYTFVDDDNEKSIRFHEKMGYRRVEKASKEIREMHGWDSAIMFEKHIEKENEKIL